MLGKMEWKEEVNGGGTPVLTELSHKSNNKDKSKTLCAVQCCVFYISTLHIQEKGKKLFY